MTLCHARRRGLGFSHSWFSGLMHRSHKPRTAAYAPYGCKIAADESYLTDLVLKVSATRKNTSILHYRHY